MAKIDPDCPSCSCGVQLATSLYINLAGEVAKSCALCSRLAGEHVFHPLREFGLWHAPQDDDRQPYPQSECLAALRARGDAGFGCITTMEVNQLRVLLKKFAWGGEGCLAARARGQSPLPAGEDVVRRALEPMRSEMSDRLAARDRPRQIQPARLPPVPQAPKTSVLRRRAGGEVARVA